MNIFNWKHWWLNIIYQTSVWYLYQFQYWDNIHQCLSMKVYLFCFLSASTFLVINKHSNVNIVYLGFLKWRSRNFWKPFFWGRVLIFFMIIASFTVKIQYKNHLLRLFKCFFTFIFVYTTVGIIIFYPFLWFSTKVFIF